MNLEYYDKILTEIIPEDSGCVVLLNGAWGSGKTHFWNDWIKKKQGNNRYAYISLFGKSNIEEIKSEILLQTFKINGYIQKTNSLLSDLKSSLSLGDKGMPLSIGLTSGLANNIISLFKRDDLSGSIICIDDFERKCKQLSVIEIMGYALFLSEQCKCKVVLIMDESKFLIDQEEVIYLSYKEKTISHEIRFLPNQLRIVDIILKDIPGGYIGGIKEALRLIPEINLRSIKKVAHYLPPLNKLINYNLKPEFKHEIGLRLVVLYYLYSKSGHDGLFWFTNSSQRPDPENPLYDLILQAPLAFGLEISYYNKIDYILWIYLTTLAISPQLLNEVVLSAEFSFKIRTKYKEACTLADKMLYDPTHNEVEYNKDIGLIIDDSVLNILSFFSFEYFHTFFELLINSNYDNKKLIHMMERCASSFILSELDSTVDFDAYVNLIGGEKYLSIIRHNINISQDVKDTLSKTRNRLLNAKSLCALISKILATNSATESEIRFLKSLSPQDISTFFHDSSINLKLIINFIVHIERHGYDFGSFSALLKESATNFVHLNFSGRRLEDILRLIQ